MATYSVKQVAVMLGTNEETVRRWIRKGSLKAEQESKKTGNVIYEEALRSFLEATPKYATTQALVMMSIIPIALASGYLLHNYAAIEDGIKKAKIPERSIEEYLNSEISAHQKEIDKKRTAIQQLEKEIKQQQQELEELKALADTIKSKKETIGNEGK